MRVLIVGAGSVGQLYGYCLQRGGADVDVYVRPKYAAEAAAGFAIYERRRGLKDPASFVPDGVLTSPGDLIDEDYDVVLLCIPSTGLRGEWFGEFARNLGDATLVSLSPALKDRAFIAEHLPREEVGWGLITSVSYPAPLPGEECPQPGTAYWFPPLAPAPFEGPAAPVDALVAALKKGGMPCKRTADVATKASFGSAVLMPIIAIMETRGWSFAEMRRDPDAMPQLHRVMQETLEGVELAIGEKRPLPSRLLGPFGLSALTRVAGLVPPFDLEVYLKVHFTKVGDQTRLFLQDYIDQRLQSGLDSPALQELLHSLK